MDKLDYDIVWVFFGVLVDVEIQLVFQVKVWNELFIVQDIRSCVYRYILKYMFICEDW